MNDLSQSEQRLIPESEAQLRSQLESELEQAASTCEARMRAVLAQVQPSTVDLIIIVDYADAYARKMIARRALDNCYPEGT